MLDIRLTDLHFGTESCVNSLEKVNTIAYREIWAFSLVERCDLSNVCVTEVFVLIARQGQWILGLMVENRQQRMQTLFLNEYEGSTYCPVFFFLQLAAKIGLILR